MKIARVPLRTGVVAPVYLSVILAGCSDEPFVPVVEQPFDPAFALEVVQDVQGALAATELGPMMSNIHYALRQASQAAGAPAKLPGSGGTYAFDEMTLAWRVDPNRFGAPADGVRFVWYAMDQNANTPLRPLVERGWVDLRMVEESERDAVMSVTFFRYAGDSWVEVVDYAIAYHETEDGSFSSTAEGTAGSIEFDIERSFTYGNGEGVYEGLVAFGKGDGLLVASITAPFDPVTREATDESLFLGSVLGVSHYLLITADVQDVSGVLTGAVESDDNDVLTLSGTTLAPIFRTPGGESPGVTVQSEMTEVWDALWGMLGDGVSLIVVLEDLFR